MKKRLTAVVLTAAMALTMASTAMAGEWAKDRFGTWWQEEDGSFPTGGWQWIDDDGDGVAECYYFSEEGYLYRNAITPDAFCVNADGQWVVNTYVQTRTAE